MDRLIVIYVAALALSSGASPAHSQTATSAHRLQAATLLDSSYNRPRRLWVYTPPGYDARAASPYPLLIAFDGAEYRDTIPLPLILDTLIATHAVPPIVAVLIDDSTSTVRIADLANAPKLVTFLAQQLLPYVRSNWRVTTDPHRVIVTGSSAGGLASAFVAFTRPDLFGNVLAQSGAFWRGANASNTAPYEWLTAQVAVSPRKDVRFVLDVGALETHATLGGSGPVFLAATRRFRDALQAKGYDLAYTEVPNGRHSPETWKQRLPFGIVAVTTAWQP